MGIDSIGSQFQAGFLSGAQQTASAGASGIFMGHAVRQVQTPESLLANAAEELTFAADTTDDFELQERKERDKASRAQEDRVRMYQELMHQAGKSEQLNSLKDSLRSRLDGRQALEKAREFFPDPSDAWAALLEIKEELEEAGDPKLAKSLEAAIAELEEREGPAVRAGIQGALSSSGFPDLGSSDQMRDFYRQTVCEFSTVNEVFAHIQQQYGGDFEAAMDFLFSAISADIGSDQPSMGIRHLESVHDNLGKVRLTQSAFRLCEEMVGRWEKVHGVAVAGGLTPMGLLGDVVALREMRFLGATQIDGILAKAKAPDIEKEVLFLQELMNMARRFPTALFDDEQGRMKVLNAVQEAVDKAVEREDEWLAQQEG